MTGQTPSDWKNSCSIKTEHGTLTLTTIAGHPLIPYAWKSFLIPVRDAINAGKLEFAVAAVSDAVNPFGTDRQQYAAAVRASSPAYASSKISIDFRFDVTLEQRL